MRCSSSCTACSSEGPPQGDNSCQQTCSSTGSLLPWDTGPASVIHLLWRGVLHGLQVDLCSPMDLTGCRRISAVVPGAHPPPLSSVTLVFAGLLLSPIVTPPQQQLLLCSNVFPFRADTPRGAVTAADDAVASSRAVSDPVGIGSGSCGEVFSSFSQKLQPNSPRYQNLSLQTRQVYS